MVWASSIGNLEMEALVQHIQRLQAASNFVSRPLFKISENDTKTMSNESPPQTPTPAQLMYNPVQLHIKPKNNDNISELANLESLTVEQLEDKCKELGIELDNKVNKDALISAIALKSCGRAGKARSIAKLREWIASTDFILQQIGVCTETGTSMTDLLDHKFRVLQQKKRRAAEMTTTATPPLQSSSALPLRRRSYVRSDGKSKSLPTVTETEKDGDVIVPVVKRHLVDSDSSLMENFQLESVDSFLAKVRRNGRNSWSSPSLPTVSIKGLESPISGYSPSTAGDAVPETNI